MQRIGNIRYFAKLDDDDNVILELDVAHDNENITQMGLMEIYTSDDQSFPILQLEKEGYGSPFWFECPNADIFDLKNEKGCEVKLCSFAYNIKVEPPKDTSSNPLANESYFLDTWDDTYHMCKAFIHGVIKGYTTEKNIVTGVDYYAIDIDCLGLHIKVLASTNQINESDIVVGNILSGKFWNSAILVADNHPDYF